MAYIGLLCACVCVRERVRVCARLSGVKTAKAGVGEGKKKDSLKASKYVTR